MNVPELPIAFGMHNKLRHSEGTTHVHKAVEFNGLIQKIKMSTFTKRTARNLCHTCLTNSEQMMPVDTNVEELLCKVNVWNGADDMQLPTETEFSQKLCNACLNAMESFNSFCARAKECRQKLLAMLRNSANEHANGVGVQLANADKNDDVDKLFLSEPLMETEALLLDGMTVACAVQYDPDPFGAATVSTLSAELCLSDDVKSVDDESLEQHNKTKQSTPKRRSEALFKCLYCNRSFSHKLSLDGHVRLQHEGITERPFRCDRCVKDYTNFGALRVHIKEIHEANESTYACDFPGCDRVYNSRIVLRNHKRKKHNETATVNHSDQSDPLASPTALSKHVNSLSDSSNVGSTKSVQMKKFNTGLGETKRSVYRAAKNLYKCMQCNRCYAHKLSLDGHVRLQHEGITERPFKCDRCDRDYTYFGGLQAHIKEAHEPHTTSYPCDYPGCDRVYASYIVMRKHKRTKHTGDTAKRCICEICGATFCETGNLNYHRRRKHFNPPDIDANAEGFQCTVCGKMLHSPYSLKYHIMQQHLKEKKFKCKVCDRLYAKKFMLVQHMLVHSMEKISCEYCGKQFSRKLERQLKKHINTVHMKVKPFQCQYCEQAFACRKTLIHHEYIHTGEKPYVCNVCGRAYRQQTCLRMHLRTHEKFTANALLNAQSDEAMLLQQYVEL